MKQSTAEQRAQRLREELERLAILSLTPISAKEIVEAMGELYLDEVPTIVARARAGAKYLAEVISIAEKAGRRANEPVTVTSSKPKPRTAAGEGSGAIATSAAARRRATHAEQERRVDELVERKARAG